MCGFPMQFLPGVDRGASESRLLIVSKIAPHFLHYHIEKWRSFEVRLFTQFSFQIKLQLLHFEFLNSKDGFIVVIQKINNNNNVITKKFFIIEAQRAKRKKHSWHPFKLHNPGTALLGHTSTDMYDILN